MTLMVNGSLIDVEAVQDRQRDVECRFNRDCVNAAWALSYETEIEDPLIKASAEIYLKEYIPQPKQYSCYSGYAQGDDHLYPII